jgi:acyl phosphate:glycerol-3-phosphate acyltransferase
VIYLIAVILGYLIGSFPTGVFLSRRRYGIDVRETGSGNIGATNVTRTFGWSAGFLTLLGDFAKGLIPVWIAHHYFGQDPWLVPAVAASLIVGHCFSAYLKFRGGKGVATSFGCMMAIDPLVALVCALVYGVVLAVTKISAVGSLAGVLAIALYALLWRPPMPERILILSICILLIIRHRSNIQRLIQGLKTKK